MAEEVSTSGVRATGYRVSPDGATLTVIARMLQTGDLRVHIDEVFDLADVADAHRRIEGGHTRGKLVLAVSES